MTIKETFAEIVTMCERDPEMMRAVVEAVVKMTKEQEKERENILALNRARKRAGLTPTGE